MYRFQPVLQFGTRRFGGIILYRVILRGQFLQFRVYRGKILCVLLFLQWSKGCRSMSKPSLLVGKVFLQLCTLHFGLLHLSVQHQTVLFELFQLLAAGLDIGRRNGNRFIFQQLAHGFAEFAQHGFVRYGSKVLLNQLSSIPAENFREVQRIEQRKNEVLTAESFRETFLRGGRAVHGKHGAAVLPDTVNSMRLAFIGAQYSFHPHHGRAAVVQPV